MIPCTMGMKETIKSISCSFRVLSDAFDHPILAYSSLRFATFKATFDMMLSYRLQGSPWCAGAEFSAACLSPRAGCLWLQPLRRWLRLRFPKNRCKNTLLSFFSLLWVAGPITESQHGRGWKGPQWVFIAVAVPVTMILPICAIS